MTKSNMVPLMLSVPQDVRDELRKMAAQQNLKNPDKVTSAAQIGREIICDFFNNQKKCREE